MSNGDGVFQNNSVDNNDSKPDNIRVRRVGTFTMGVSLIFVGIAIIVALFSESFSVYTVAKFSPIILVCIGIEILIENFRNKSDKIRYDFLSGFVCFVLIFGSLLASCIPLGIKYFGPEREAVTGRLSQDVYDKCYSVLKDDKISQLDSHVYINQYDYDKNITIEDLSSADRINLNISLSETYESPVAFAQKSKEILNKLNTTGIDFDWISLTTDNGSDESGDYQLDIDGKFQFNMTAQELEKYVM